MKKEKYYTHIPERSKGHRIAISTWKIEKNFYTQKDALKFRDEVKASIDELSAALQYLKAKNFKERLSPSDYALLKDEVDGDIHPLLDRLICYVPSGSEVPSKNKTDPTVQDIMLAYLAHREELEISPPKKELCRYTHWVDVAEIAKMRTKNVTPAMIEVERNRISKTRRIAPSTVNRYINCLGAAWTHYIKVSTSGVFIPHVPQQVTDLDENTIHTESYTTEQVHEILDHCYQADEDCQYQNQTTFEYLGPIIDLAAQTGMRSQFLQEMHIDEVFNLDTDDAFIRKPMKGGKLCTVPLTNRAKRVIKKQKELGTGWLFPMPDGEHVEHWYNRFKRLLIKKGCKITSKPRHSFRAYTATNLRDLGLGVDDIAEMLGVTSQTVKGYINRTDKQRKRITKIMNDAKDF